MKTCSWNSPRYWLAATLVLASLASAVSPFTLRFGASGSLTLPMTYDPTDPDGELLMFQMGFRAGASDGLDVYDSPKPTITPEEGFPLLYFPADAPVNGLSQDYRPPTPSAVWELNLVGMTAGAAVTLQWALVADGGSLDGRQLSLVDRSSGAILVNDMTTTTSTALADADRSLLIIYGAANHPPVARGDFASMLQSSGSVQIPFAHLLANDYDIDVGDTFDVFAVGNPYYVLGSDKGASAYGTTTLDLVGRTVTYSPPATLPEGWSGIVNFSYSIRDNHPTDPRETTATVEVIVAPTVLAVPTPSNLAMTPGSALTVTYVLNYATPLNSLSLAFSLPFAGTAPALVSWSFDGGSYSDNAAGTADPVVGGAGADGVWGTPDDASAVVLDFGTALPPSGTQFSFRLNVPPGSTSKELTALATYKVTGAEPAPLQQVMPDLSVRAAFTITFAASANGTLTGVTSQLLEPGLLSTQVTAVPNLGYRFLRWMRGDTEISRANPLVIAGGAADMTITAQFEPNQFTVTFAVSGSGTLLGVTPQTVPYGGTTTPVTAQPADGHYFVQWSDGSTANPRTVTNVLASATITAQFLPLEAEEDMQGHFDLAYTDQTNASLRKIWDLTGHYTGAVGAYVLTLDLDHDEKGTLIGTGRLQGSVGGQAIDVVGMPVKGSGKGKSGVVTVKATLKGSNATTAASLKLALTLSGLTLTGTVSGSVTDTVGGKAAISSPCTFNLPAGMNGSYTLPVELVMDAKGAITGTCLLTLANGRTVDMLVKGKRSGGLALLQFAGNKVADPAFAAVKIKITIQPYTNRTAAIRAMSGKAFGQSLKWPL